MSSRLACDSEAAASESQASLEDMFIGLLIELNSTDSECCYQHVVITYYLLCEH